MYGLRPFAAALIAVMASVATAAKYCDDATKVCFSEATAGGVTYRAAIPNVTAAPFDMILQIVAPKSAGWAAIAWGGQMATNPITLGWPNDKATVVSSRWTTGHTMPTAYTGATYTVLAGSSPNSTHWTLTALCTGCSQWTGSGATATKLNPATTATVAYALSSKAPAEPANNASSISIHTAKGKFTLDLGAARTADFNTYVQTLTGQTSGSEDQDPDAQGEAA